MTDRLWVYPLLLVTGLPLVLLLRRPSRWLLSPILRHGVVLLVAIVALGTGGAAVAWGAFAGLILLPRLIYQYAIRCLKTGQVHRAEWWRRLARFGVPVPPDTNDVPAEVRGEIRLWQLWTLTGTGQWLAAVEFYEAVEAWGLFQTALHARLAAARAYWELAEGESAVRCLTMVALSPRLVGSLARDYRECRARITGSWPGLEQAESQMAEWRALVSWRRPGRMTVGLLAGLGAVQLSEMFVAAPLYEAFGNLPWNAIHGEWYRPVTALLLHAGWGHWALNGVALWMFGTAVESTGGGARMVVIFLGAGTLANVASAGLGGFDVSVGASGGVFALVGAFAVAVYRLRSPFQAGMRRQMLGMVGLMVAVDLGIGGLEPQIDNIAHGTGFVAGVLLALGWLPKSSTRSVGTPIVAP